MRISQAKIQAMLRTAKDKLTDQELFGSGIMAAHLTNYLRTIAPKRKIRVKIVWQPSKVNFLAATNSTVICINPGNPLYLEAATRELTFLWLLGTGGHEVGHILFSDFDELALYVSALHSGRLYPAVPDDLMQEEEDALTEIQQLCSDRDETAQYLIVKTGHYILNCLEDYYVDFQMYDRFPGSIGQGIILFNAHVADTYPSIIKMIEQGLSPLSIMKRLLLQYARYGSINNLGDYEGEYLDLLYDCIPMIDDAVCNGISSRMLAANRILLRMWPYLKKAIEQKHAAKEADDSAPPPSDERSEDPKGDSETSDVEDEDDDFDFPADEDDDQGAIPQLPRNIEYPDESGAAPDKSEGGDRAAYDCAIKSLLAPQQEEGGRIPLRKTSEISEGSVLGRTMYDPDYQSVEYKYAAADIARLLTETASKAVYENCEQELSKELQAEAGKIRLGNAHKGIHIIIHRMCEVPQELIDQYETIAPELIALSQRVQKDVFPELADMCLPVTHKGLLSGSSLHASSLYRKDGRVFRKTSYPQEDFDLAVAVLADESGSMWCGDRITMTRAASIVLYDCCTALGVPVMICGHTQDGPNDEELHIQSYAEYESVDRNDRYRIMDMMPRSSNRDGAALRYICNRLTARSEQRKLLFVISDGQPSAIGYAGTEAEADMRGIKQEYERKGITFIAAAIGADKENIQRIYGSSYLDVTDLKKLPSKLAELLLQSLR